MGATESFSEAKAWQTIEEGGWMISNAVDTDISIVKSQVVLFSY
jgi:hypothetical protein